MSTNMSTHPQLTFKASTATNSAHLDIWDNLGWQPFYSLFYLTGVMCFVGCRSLSRSMSFIGFSLRFRPYRHLDYTQLIHAVQVPARLRMHDGVTPQSGFCDVHTQVVSRYRWTMDYRKTHTAPPSCPSAPFFEARDVTHNRDILDTSGL